MCRLREHQAGLGGGSPDEGPSGRDMRASRCPLENTGASSRGRISSHLNPDICTVSVEGTAPPPGSSWEERLGRAALQGEVGVGQAGRDAFNLGWGEGRPRHSSGKAD